MVGKQRSLWKGSIARGIANFGFCLTMLVYVIPARAGNDLDIEVRLFLGNYFQSARDYDVFNMIDLSSRAVLASNIRPIL